MGLARFLVVRPIGKTSAPAAFPRSIDIKDGSSTEVRSQPLGFQQLDRNDGAARPGPSVTRMGAAARNIFADLPLVCIPE